MQANYALSISPAAPGPGTSPVVVSKRYEATGAYNSFTMAHKGREPRELHTKYGNTRETENPKPSSATPRIDQDVVLVISQLSV